MTESCWQTMVWVVDDDEAMRDSMRCLFESVNLPCKTFASAHDFLAGCDSGETGCILLDIRMPGMSGMELLEELGAQGIQMPVIIITGHGDVPLAVSAIKQGAFDFIQKPFNPRDLLGRVHAAIELAQQSYSANRKLEGLRNCFDTLTRREKEIMELLVAGNPSKVIGSKLGISSKTVDIHRSNIMKKVSVRTIAELVQYRLALRDEKSH